MVVPFLVPSFHVGFPRVKLLDPAISYHRLYLVSWVGKPRRVLSSILVYDGRRCPRQRLAILLQPIIGEHSELLQEILLRQPHFLILVPQLMQASSQRSAYSRHQFILESTLKHCHLSYLPPRKSSVSFRRLRQHIKRKAQSI